MLVNANVLTMDPGRGRGPPAVAVAGGRITALDEVPAGAERVIDLRGATVLPGFHDAHNHMTGFGMSLGEVDLRADAAGTLDELYAAVARRAGTTPPGEWVIGSGYDQNKLGGHPHRDALDRAAPGRRVWLRHTSGHMCVVNGVVLADLGVDAAATEIPGGLVAVDDGGRPTGLLEERAQLLVGSLVYPYPLAELADAIARAAAQYLKEGVTSCTEAGIGGGWVAHSPAELAAYQLARDQGRLGVRVELMTAGEVLHPLGAHAGDNLPAGLDLGIRSGFGDDWLRLGATKIFADGSLVGRTAAMNDPYAGSGGTGYLQADAADLQALIIAAHRSGWQVATHAIGDRAIDVVLDAYERALAEYPRPDPRHRIEHFAVVRPAAAGPGRRARRDRGAAGTVRLRAGRRHARRGRAGPARLAVPAALAARGGHGAAGQLGPAGGGRGAAARHRRHGEPADQLRRAVQPGRGGHRRSRRCAPGPGVRPTPAARSTSRARSPPACSPTWWCCPRTPPRSARTASPAWRCSPPSSAASSATTDAWTGC